MLMNQIYLETAIKAARQNGPLFKNFFGRPGKVNLKAGNPRDMVTEIDRRIETSIRRQILRKFPKAKIIGEEFAHDEAGPEDLVWIIDPIDGTTNYIHGLPLACISLALWQGHKPLVGVVYNPVTNQLYHAVKNKGAYLNGQRIFVSRQTRPIKAFGSIGWGRDVQAAGKKLPGFIKTLGKVRSFGSTAWELCLVASGQMDYYIQMRAKIWDFAAAALVVKEAGGKITELSGKNLTVQSGNLLAANKTLHPKLLQLTGFLT